MNSEDKTPAPKLDNLSMIKDQCCVKLARSRIENSTNGKTGGRWDFIKRFRLMYLAQSLLAILIFCFAGFVIYLTAVSAYVYPVFKTVESNQDDPRVIIEPLPEMQKPEPSLETLYQPFFVNQLDHQLLSISRYSRTKRNFETNSCNQNMEHCKGVIDSMWSIVSAVNSSIPYLQGFLKNTRTSKSKFVELVECLQCKNSIVSVNETKPENLASGQPMIHEHSDRIKNNVDVVSNLLNDETRYDKHNYSDSVLESTTSRSDKLEQHDQRPDEVVHGGLDGLGGKELDQGAKESAMTLPTTSTNGTMEYAPRKDSREAINATSARTTLKPEETATRTSRIADTEKTTVALNVTDKPDTGNVMKIANDPVHPSSQGHGKLSEPETEASKGSKKPIFRDLQPRIVTKGMIDSVSGSMPTAETIKSTQQLQLTPTMSWVPYQVCFYGPGANSGVKQSGPGQIAYPASSPGASYQAPISQHRQGYQNSNQAPSYVQVQAQSVQFLPMQSFPGNQGQAGGQRIGPTGPATPNFPMFPGQTSPSGGGNSNNKTPYYCTYIPAPTFQFPAIPGVSDYQRSSVAYDKDETQNEVEQGTPEDQKAIFGYSEGCPSNTIRCGDGRRCILRSQWCDGQVDCNDASDETTCSCRDRISQERLCDGYFDCPHGEDEMGCLGCPKTAFSCNDWQRRYSADNCVPLSQRCDGIKQCANGKDEMDCNILTSSYIEGKNAFSIGYIEGYLHKNFKGQWYPVCTATKSWVKDACASEIDSSVSDTPEIKVRSVPENAYQGPYLAEVNGRMQLIPSCMNTAIFVRCPSFSCGTSTFPHKGLLRPDVLENEDQDYSQILDGIVWPVSEDGIDPRFGKGKTRKDQDDLVGSQLRVVGGRASEPKAWPFLVAIYKNGLFYCGGVILNELWVLTAAHCLDDYAGHYFEVQAGVLRRFSFSPMSQSRKARYTVMHPQYNSKVMRNDIGIIMLDDPLRFNRWVRPICLPGPEILGPMWRNKPEPNSTCIAIGWGATREHGPDPDHLREVEVPILQHCKHQIDQNEAAICAGYPQGGRDACQGDSGGPLLCRNPYLESQWYVAGVVSHGEGCGRPDEPGAYTRVSYFLDWIREITSGRGVPPLRRTPLEKCPGFSCEGGLGKCLPIEARCNGIVDCLDGEDEVNCRDYYPIYRLLNNYTSDFESALLKETANSSMPEEIFTTDHAITNNTIDDTTDASVSAENRDIALEFDDNGSTTSTTMNTTTSSGINYTETESTIEPILFPTIFTCTRLLQSIPIQEKCNRIVDCEDGTDEINCTCKEYLQNLKPSAICDGYADCDDLTDEQDCALCGQDEFLCKTSETCIPMSKKCDGHFDCKFKEDELDCFTLTDGQYVYLDGDKRPFLNQEGFLTQYVDGKWRLSCHRPRMHRNQSTVTLIGRNMCEYFGFSNLHSTESIVVKNSTLETVALRKGSCTYQENSSAASLSERRETCLGLYVRCAPTLSSSINVHLAIDASTGDRDYLWPWTAAIFVNGRYRCTALLLGPEWLLSAAKCLENFRPKEDYTTAIVGYGASFRHVDGPHQQISIIDEVHSMNNSISILLHLKNKVHFSRHVQPLFVDKRIYLSGATDTCVAVGTNENYETKSIFLRPVIQDCSNCQRCFQRITDSDCSESPMSTWSGTIFCRGKKGWYPAAVFQDNEGLCNFKDTQNMTSIDYINPYLVEAMDDPRKPIEPSCNGFRCKLGECIPRNRVCDGVPDCRDQEDENPKYYDIYRKNCQNSVDGCSCGKTELRCRDGKCVDKSAFCDGYVDCVDGSDEPTTCTCAEYLKLTAPERICDGVRHCLDKTDESPETCPCTESSFNCKTLSGSDTCIPKDFICDGTDDCLDGKDEKSCRKLITSYQNDSYYSGEVIRQSYGVWHSECFQSPLTSDNDASDLCKSMGYSSGSVNNETIVMDEPMIPKRDDFYVVRINSLIWMILRDDKPLITLNKSNETCHRALVNCEFEEIAYYEQV